jgi:hypothetical protein
VLGVAGFVIWAVQYSDFGDAGTATVNLRSAPPPVSSPVAVRLANALGRANLGRAHRAVDMAAIAPFAWDRLHVFASATSLDIRRDLGFDWPGAPDTVPRPGRRETLLVFVSGGRIAGSVFFSEAIGRLDCLALNPAGYARGTSFRVRFARDKTAFLSTRRPAGPERSCLRAAGVKI